MADLEVLERLADLAADHREASDRVRSLTQTRDELVREASEKGLSRRDVAAAAGLTPGRVQQILQQAGFTESSKGTLVGGPQHLRALEHANRVRLARAELKREIKAGTRSVADVLRESPSEVQSLALGELLMSQKRWGRERARRLLLSLGIPENKQVGALTERQRVGLVELLTAPETNERGARSRLKSKAMPVLA